MIAQLVAQFLAFGAVFVFGMIWGLEVGSKRGWHRGRAALIREQRGVRASIDRGDRVIRLPAQVSTEEFADLTEYARKSHLGRPRPLFDQENA